MKKLESTELEAETYLPEGGIISTASEIEENVDAVRAAFGKMETIKQVLVEKQILVNRYEILDNVDKTVDEL